MKLTLSLDDDLFDAYKAMGTGAIQSTTAAIVSQLRRFASVSPHDRALVLYGDDRRAVEAVFQISISTGAELAKRIQGLAKFQIGDVIRPFTEGELITLAEQARFHGRAPADYARMVADDVVARTLDRI